MRDFYLRWWRGSEPVVGMEVRDDVVLCAQSTTRTAAQESSKRFSIPLPLGVVENGRMRDPLRLVSSLRDSLELSQLSGCRCAVAIPANATFSAQLAVPDDVVFTNEGEACEWALTRLSFDPSYVCGKVYLDESDFDSGRRLLVVATKRSVQEMFREVFEAVGLEFSCLTLRSLALHKGAAMLPRHLRKTGTVWVDLTDRSAALHLFEGEKLLFSRYLNAGLSGDTELSITRLISELGELDVSRYAKGEVAILCAGPEAVVRQFTTAWSDATPLRRGPLSVLVSGEGGFEDRYCDPYLIAEGLVHMLRESP